MSKTDKLIKIEQTGSPIRRQPHQRETLIWTRASTGSGGLAQVPEPRQTAA
jgi:hypothetical protein